MQRLKEQDRVMLRLSELPLDKALPWPVYDGQGYLLFNQGFVLNNARQRNLILNREGVRPADYTGDEPSVQTGIGDAQLFTMHELSEYLLCRLEAVNRAIFSQERSLSYLLTSRLALDIQYLVEVCPDRLLAILLLDDEAVYQLIHPLHTAVLCEMTACELQWSRQMRLPLLCAALTHDLAIQDAQKTIDQQAEPISNEQWEEIRQHSLASVKLLEAAGIRHEGWLEAVRCHHERLDGSGYPLGLQGAQLSLPARILAIADTFSAMMRYRAHRDALHTQNILLKLYHEKAEQYDATLVSHMIDAVGLIVPGSLVQLQDDTIAIAVARGKQFETAVLVGLLRADGSRFTQLTDLDMSQPHYQLQGFLPRDNYRWLLTNLDPLWPAIPLMLI